MNTLTKKYVPVMTQVERPCDVIKIEQQLFHVQLITDEKLIKYEKLIADKESIELDVKQQISWVISPGGFSSVSFDQAVPYFFIKIRLKNEKNILLSSSRSFSLSTPTFSLSASEDNSKATWKKATKCKKP